MEKKSRITLLPLKQSFEVEKGSELHDVLFVYGVEFPCGGHARCRGCRILIKGGTLPITSPQKQILNDVEIKDGWRLACQGIVNDDLIISISYTFCICFPSCETSQDHCTRNSPMNDSPKIFLE